MFLSGLVALYRPSSLGRLIYVSLAQQRSVSENDSVLVIISLCSLLGNGDVCSGFG